MDEWELGPIRGSSAAVSDCSPSMSNAPSHPAVSPKRDRARVLVMDDDPSFRNLVSAVLRTRYLISVADDGLAGLQKIKESRPDVALIDVQMPGLDGLQTLAAIRKDPTLSHLWAIMLTADASRETVLAAIHAGADDYLIKTAFSKEEVVRKIDRLLERERSVAKSASPVVAGSPLVAAAPGLHHAPSDRNLAPESGEILNAPWTANLDLDRPFAKPPELQEILDSWD